MSQEVRGVRLMMKDRFVRRGRRKVGDDGFATEDEAVDLDALFAVAYAELHDLARAHRRQWRGDETLNTTALVHEVYLKLARQQGSLRDARCLLAVASTAMRHVLVNYAERRKALKRGAGADLVPLAQVGPSALTDAGTAATADEVLALDAALEQLALMSSRQSRVVECRFFGGLTVEETAAALEISSATVKRDWRLASAWLYDALKTGASSPLPSPYGA